MSTEDGRLKWDNYQKIGPTYTESLTDRDIAEKLENYEEVRDIDYVPINTHVRYFLQDKETAKWKFRLGGFLKKKDNPKYVVLSTSPNLNGKTWSVSRNNAVFFRIKSPDEQKTNPESPTIGDQSNKKPYKPKELERDDLIEQYQRELKNKNTEVEILKSELLKLQSQVNTLIQPKKVSKPESTKIILAKSKKIPPKARLATKK